MTDNMIPAPANTEAKTVAADRGMGWWTDGWALFMRSAMLWVVLGLIMIVICVVISLVPILGGLALALLMPVFIGSWMLAAKKTSQ